MTCNYKVARPLDAGLLQQQKQDTALGGGATNAFNVVWITNRESAPG